MSDSGLPAREWNHPDSVSLRAQYGRPVHQREYDRLRRAAERREREEDEAYLGRLRRKYDLPPKQNLDEPQSGDPIQSYTLAELGSLELPPRDFLMEPWIRAADLMMLHGPRGIGKTQLGDSIGIAVASGASLLAWTAPKPRHVLLVDGEMPVLNLRERLQGLARGMNADPGEYLKVISVDLLPDGLPSLAAPQGQGIIDASLGPAELLILDNASSLCRGIVENDAEAWDPIQAWLLSLRRRGVAVLLVTHSGKSGDQRGSSKREDVLSTVLRLDRPEGHSAAEGARFKLSFTKTRQLFDARTISVALEDGPSGGDLVWTVSNVLDEKQTKIEQLRSEGLSLRKIAGEVGMTHANVAKRLRKSNADSPGCIPYPS